MIAAKEQDLVLQNVIPSVTALRKLLQFWISMSQSSLHFYNIYLMLSILIPEAGIGVLRDNIEVTYLKSVTCY